MIDISNSKGFNLLNNNQIYINNKQMFDFIDNEGYLYRSNYNNISRKNCLDRFGKHNPYNIYNIRNYINIKEIKSTLLSESCDGTKDFVEIKCKCVNVYKTKLEEFLYNNKTSCNKCSHKDRWNINKIKDYLSDNNINLILISEKYINTDKLLLWKCKCGIEFKRSFHHISSGYNMCTSCSAKKGSSLENKTELFLIENNINYSKQYRFDGCKNKRKLPFDFAILDNKNKVLKLIECDGEQHFNIIKHFGEKSFKLTQQNDMIKNNYCKENKIQLIRIPYWEFKNKNYIKILQTNI